jgi:hypothetical protein
MLYISKLVVQYRNERHTIERPFPRQGAETFGAQSAHAEGLADLALRNQPGI